MSGVPLQYIFDTLLKLEERIAKLEKRREKYSNRLERRLEAVKKIVDTALNNPRLKMETLEDEVAYLCSALKAIQMLFTEGAAEEELRADG